MVKKELVSVIIPTYKRAFRLDKTIDSVLNQVYSNIEIIVVDDNSEGDKYRIQTELMMNRYIDDERIHYLKHTINKGGSAARNTGIEFSSGEYISFLDDDDLFMNNKIDRQVSLLKSNSDFDAICCAHSSKYKTYTYRINELEENSTGNYLFELLAGKVVLAAGSTMLIKRSAVLELGGFDESFKRHQDWEFLVRFFRNFKMKLLNENLVVINVDGERNYPNAENFYKIKQQFLTAFRSDLLKLDLRQYELILANQIKETILVFWQQGRIKEGLKIAKECKINIGSDVYFILYSLYSIIEGKFIFIRPFKYKIMSLKYLFK